jgi:anti-anti-sigma factor
MEFKISYKENLTIVKFYGSIDLYSCSELKKIVLDILDKETNGIIIDLKDIELADSSALGTFIMCQRYAEEKSKTFALLNASEDFINLLQLSHMDDFFRIYHNYDEL